MNTCHHIYVCSYKEGCVSKLSAAFPKLKGYLPSVFVNGSTMGRIDPIAVSVNPFDQAMVASSSDRVQSRGEATLGSNTHYQFVVYYDLMISFNPIMKSSLTVSIVCSLK